MLDRLLDAFISWQALAFVIWLALFVHALITILAAEGGRRFDLVKRRLREVQGYHFDVLVPVITEADVQALPTLAQTLAQQHYAVSHIHLHVVAPQHLLERLEDMADTTKPLTMVARAFPAGYDTTPGAMLAWLITRCLATGALNRVFVFLRASDAVKPDFLDNVAHHVPDMAIFQGYVSQRGEAIAGLGRWLATQQRLTNRISNAGRFHRHQPPLLMETGWAARQEVLEMVPYRRGHTSHHLEYSLRLHEAGLAVGWAPHMVVYADNSRRPGWWLFAVAQARALLDRLRLASRYLLPLGWQSVRRGRLSELVLSLLAPSHFSLTGLLIAASITLALTGWVWEARAVAVMALSAILLHLLGLLVARARFTEVVSVFAVTPLVWLWLLVTLPWLTPVCALIGLLSRRRARHFRMEMARTGHHRDRRPPGMLGDTHQTFFDMPVSFSGDVSTLFDDPPPPTQKDQPHESAPQLPQTERFEVAVTNGSKQLSCELVLDDSAAGSQATLNYKGAAFSSNSHGNRRDAFYELLTRLRSRNLVLLTCGGCGKFYDGAEAIAPERGDGLCLLGKAPGTQLNPATDRVTLVTPACAYRVDIAERPAHTQAWKQA